MKRIEGCVLLVEAEAGEHVVSILREASVAVRLRRSAAPRPPHHKKNTPSK